MKSSIPNAVASTLRLDPQQPRSALVPVQAASRPPATARPSGSFVEGLLHRALTHPLAVAAKRPLKDGWWSVRGKALRNPPLPAQIESMLFVCKGNICRSPFAALRASQLLQQARKPVRCVSAGITATQAARPPEEAAEAALAFGCSLADHEPLRLTREMIDASDLIVVMEAEQLVLLRQRYPHAIGRLFLLSLIDEGWRGYARYNIADPFGCELAAFRSCYARIDAALATLVSILPAVSREGAVCASR
jgi:protein-tyrosine phosphatase